MSKRASGWLSSFQLVAAVEGLLRTTEDLKLDPEERRRLEATQETRGPLEEEAKKSNLVTDPVVRVRSCDEVVDRDWRAVYGVLAKLAPLDGVLPLGTEAAKIVRKVFPSKLDFIRKDATVQAQIGRGKLDELEATEMSPELSALFRAPQAVAQGPPRLRKGHCREVGHGQSQRRAKPRTQSHERSPRCVR